MQYTLAIVNPGHFHAGLVLRQKHPKISEQVYIYSEGGADLDNYMKLVNAFNSREEQPTSWKFEIYTGADYLEKAVQDKKGDIAILAGKNNLKVDYVNALHKAGFHVLADKPMTINQSGVEKLKQSLSGSPLVMDIMTERHEATSALQRQLILRDEVFGGVQVREGQASIEKSSIHHLYKTVNGAPLVRPPWYFDVGVQGEGIVDVTTHLADVCQWTLQDGHELNYANDVKLLEAKRWPTEIPLDKFQQITKLESFPQNLEKDIQNGILNYYCNGSFSYSLKGVPINISVIWNLQAPEGGGDTLTSIVRGNKADIMIQQSPETNFKSELVIKPKQLTDTYVQQLQSILDDLPKNGLKAIQRDQDILIEIPDSERTGHEQHFAMVLDEFLGHIENGLPAYAPSQLLCKYQLLAEAKALAEK